MTKITLSLILFLLIAISPLAAQKQLRSERHTYTLREDSQSGVHSDSTNLITIKDYVTIKGNEQLAGECGEFDLPVAWYDKSVMIHFDGSKYPRTILLNGEELTFDADYLTPLDYQLNSHLKSGRNRIDIIFHKQKESPLDEGLQQGAKPQGGGFEGCYLYAEPRRRIVDYDVRILPDTSGLFAWLQIEAVVENSFNYREPLTVGFDIYNPEGKLLDYTSRPITIEGGARDTVRFRTYIYNADKFRWSSEKPHLYDVTLTTKSGAIFESYTPLKVAYLDREYRDGELYNFGKRVDLKPFRFNVSGDENATRGELKQLKAAGYNTLRPTYPQPIWFYDLCDSMGFYVVEQASINAPQGSDNRAIGGTPSNDPTLLEEYLDRVKTSYYRVRQHPSVIAFSLGEESGNGYNMYKAYEWLKSVERVRPVIYVGAKGEWNSDKFNLSK